jgi:hypothetical protein
VNQPSVHHLVGRAFVALRIASYLFLAVAVVGVIVATCCAVYVRDGPSGPSTKSRTIGWVAGGRLHVWKEVDGSGQFHLFWQSEQVPKPRGFDWQNWTVWRSRFGTFERTWLPRYPNGANGDPSYINLIAIHTNSGSVTTVAVLLLIASLVTAFAVRVAERIWRRRLALAGGFEVGPTATDAERAI